MGSPHRQDFAAFERAAKEALERVEVDPGWVTPWLNRIEAGVEPALVPALEQFFAGMPVVGRYSETNAKSIDEVGRMLVGKTLRMLFKVMANGTWWKGMHECADKAWVKEE